MMKVSELKLNPKNPRVIRDDKFFKLVKSIQEFPKMLNLRPMVVDENNFVLGGNMRLKAIKELQYKEIPDSWVVRASDLTEEEKQRFIIADNVSFGDWDFEELQASWDKEELNGWGADVDWPEPILHAGEDENLFNDPGITPQNKFAVVITCADAAEQEATFNELTQNGYNCKILVV